MNRPMTIAAVLAALTLAAGPALADAKPAAPAKPNHGFEKMKSLAGEWQGTTREGMSVKVTYVLTADGSALMERLEPGTEPPMVTMYHPDGSRVLMTHYCAAHNQPRMRAETAAADPKTLVFNFVDVTNLSSPDDAHMRHLVVGFEDKDHFTQEWTYKAKDKESVEVFRYERKK
jgi:hypothetical protein